MDDDDKIGFDDWLKTIEQGKKNYYGIFDLKRLLIEAAKRFGRRGKNMSKEDIDKVYNEWIGAEVFILETEEVVNRIRDIYEAEFNPIAHCEECEAIGKVCYENDGGFSHRLSQGKLSMEELNNRFYNQKP